LRSGSRNTAESLILCLRFNPDHRLRSYVLDYIEQDIHAEALTRNAPAFAKFLEAVAVTHGRLINYSSCRIGESMACPRLKNPQLCTESRPVEPGKDKGWRAIAMSGLDLVRDPAKSESDVGSHMVAPFAIAPVAGFS